MLGLISLMPQISLTVVVFWCSQFPPFECQDTTFEYPFTFHC